MIKYKYPLISPITPLVIAPLELSCLLMFIRVGAFRLEYAPVVYTLWVLVEIVLIAVILRCGFVKKERRYLYFDGLIVVTIVMFFLVTIKEYQLFFTYANTIVGVLFWFIHFIRHKDYPLTLLTIIIFTLKFVADAIGIPVYFHRGGWPIAVFSVFLPLLDFCFIVVFLLRKLRVSREKSLIVK